MTDERPLFYANDLVPTGITIEELKKTREDIRAALTRGFAFLKEQLANGDQDAGSVFSGNLGMSVQTITVE
jgi:hypothetical protein